MFCESERLCEVFKEADGGASLREGDTCRISWEKRERIGKVTEEGDAPWVFPTTAGWLGWMGEGTGVTPLRFASMRILSGSLRNSSVVVEVSNVGVGRSEREGRDPQEVNEGLVSSGEWRVPRSSAECAQLSFEILRRSPLASECKADGELSVVRAEGELRSRTDLGKVSANCNS